MSRASKPRKSPPSPGPPPKAGAKAKPWTSEANRLKRMAGRNRQIAKADGDAPVPARMRGREQAAGKPASRLIDQRIRDLGGWRGETLARMRALILEADPEITEEWKWMGTPVWSHDGIVCTGEAYAKVVKLTFARGAMIPDPSRLFNSSLEGNTRRAIDIHEGEKVNARAFRALVKAAVARNGPPAKKAKPGASEAKPINVREGEKVVLLSGGNPQIAKADGDAPVQAYIAATPGWKSDVGKRLDALIVRNVPNVHKAVKWNSPFYGIDGQGWFLSFHVFTRYVKVTFFRGTSLRPIPPGGTVRSKDARWIDIHEGGELDEAQMAIWVKQAAALAGWVPGRPS
jgi:hypothetical protein